MNQTTKNWQPRTLKTNLSAQSQFISPEIKAEENAKSEQRYQKAKAIFNQLLPNLIEQYYNWYLVINPDTEEYFIEQEYLQVFTRLRQQPEKGKMVIFCLNETAICGQI